MFYATDDGLCSMISVLYQINLSFVFRKSTFFNVLTKSQAAAENFPFCTIDPNESMNVLLTDFF